MILNNLRRMASVLAVDVGAAAGLQPHWLPFAQDLDFILVEPDIEACKALEAFVQQHHMPRDRCQIINAAVGLKSEVRCLYLSNARTGSSLFPFKKLDQNNYYFESSYTPDDYVFPIATEIVSTIRFGDLLSHHRALPHLVKLDTQGSELEILNGMDEPHWDSLCAIEIEIGSPGGYIGSCSLGAVASQLEDRRFQLMDLRLARLKPIFHGGDVTANEPFPTNEARSKPVRQRIWEMDCVFIRDPAYVLKLRDKAQTARLITTFVVYRLFNEALALTGRAEAIGIFDEQESHAVRSDLRAAYDQMKLISQRGYDNCWDAFV